MKSPDEIKKGLECCARVGCCHTCPYDEECHSSHDDACPMHMDALALIQQLKAENAQLLEKVDRFSKAAFEQNMAILSKQDVITKQERVRANLQSEIWELKQQVPRWISVEERLPDSRTPAYENDMSNAVLLYTPVDGYVHIGWYVRKNYRGHDVWHTLSAMRSQQTLTKKVTHWMPLPEPPKED